MGLPPRLSDVMESYAKIRLIEKQLEAQLHKQLALSRNCLAINEPGIIQSNISRINQLVRAVGDIKAGEADTYYKILFTLLLHQKAFPVESNVLETPLLSDPSLDQSTYLKVAKPRKLERKTFIHPVDLNQRLDEAESRREERGGYLCDFPNCGHLTVSRFSLRRHLFSHETFKTYNCEFHGCDRSFAKATSLARHQLVHTEKDRLNVASQESIVLSPTTPTTTTAPAPTTATPTTRPTTRPTTPTSTGSKMRPLRIT